MTGDRDSRPDPTVLRALSRAHAWAAEQRSGKYLSENATATTNTAACIHTRTQLAFLSPAIQRAIPAGRQPPDVTLDGNVRKPVPRDRIAQTRLYRLDDIPGHH